MEKFLYPTHLVRCIITRPGGCGKSAFLTNSILNTINEYDKKHIYSPSLHQDLYQKLIKCFTNYIPIRIIPNILNEKVIGIVIDEIVKNKDCEKSDTELEIYESIEELKLPQEYDDGGIIILDDLNEEEMNDPLVQAMFNVAKTFIWFFQTRILVSRGYFPGKLFSTNQIFNLIYFPLEHFFPKDDKKNRQIRHSCISGGQKRFLKKTVIWKNYCFLNQSGTLRNNFANFCRKTLDSVFKTTFYVSFSNILGKTADLYGKLIARFSKRHSACPVELVEPKKN